MGVRTALFPVGGLGTRFLPATKAVPKEMLPVVDKPLIQYGVEEAMEAGMNNIGIVTGRGKRALAEENYEVEVANNGIDGLRLAFNYRPDLVLLDVMMPGMDGFEVCRRLKRIPEIADNPVIFITGSSEEADHVKGLEMGAVDFIAKPINITVLKQRVALHLRLISAIKDGLIEIEARKRAEKMLQKSERLYRMLAENITDVIWTVDENQNYTYVSPSIFNLLGYKPLQKYLGGMVPLSIGDFDQIINQACNLLLMGQRIFKDSQG